MFIILIIFIFLFGLIVGSFLNCLIWRLHTGEGIGGRSKCPKCRKQIAWYDNIPVFSFLMLRGKCRKCGKKISWQYPVVEFATGILFVVSFIIAQPTPAFGHSSSGGDYVEFIISNLLTSNFLLLTLKSWFLISVMIVIFVYDLRWYLIPDIVTLPAAGIIFILNLLLGFNWQVLAISGIIGSSFFLFQFLVSRGKWIGGGDIRLGLLMGLALGWPAIITALLLAYFSGAIIGLGLIALRKKSLGSKLPFGVFLSTATVIVMLWGEAILDAYYNIIF